MSALLVGSAIVYECISAATQTFKSAAQQQRNHLRVQFTAAFHLQFIEELVASVFLFVLEVVSAQHSDDHLTENAQDAVAHRVRLQTKHNTNHVHMSKFVW